MSDPEAADRAGEGRTQQDSFTDAQDDRDRTLTAVRRLEAALARPAGGEMWASGLRQSLDALREAMVDEQHELDRPDSLLSMIAAERPRRFGPRVRGIKDQFADINRQLDAFRRELGTSGPPLIDVGDLRHRAAWIVRALHNCRNRQADLVYEAVGLDLGSRHDD